MDIVLYALTALLYGGLCAADWRALRRARTPVGAAPEVGARASPGALASPAPRAWSDAPGALHGGKAGDKAGDKANGEAQAPHGLPAPRAFRASGAPSGLFLARPPSSPSSAPGMSAPFRALLFVALVAHGLLLHVTIFPRDGMMFGFAFALSAMFWLGAVIYWIERFFFALDGLRLLLLPLAALASLMPLAFGGVRVLPYAAVPMFKLHFVIANAAYGLFALAALHAVLMLVVERWLHAPRAALAPKGTNGTSGASGAGRARAGGLIWLASWLDTLPPLLTLEKLLFRLIGAGFVLLTLTLVSGILFSEQLSDRPLSFDHKTVFALLSWLMFGALLSARRLSGWRGRAALRWVLASFGALLLAYVGSRFVFEVLLHRPVV